MKYKNVNDYEVIYMIRENDEDSEKLMYEKYSPLLYKYVNKYYSLVSHRITYEDLVQETRIALDNAIKTFNENSDVLFYTYVSICIERHLLTYCRNVNSNKHYILNNSVLDEFIEEKYVNDMSCLDILINNENFISMKNKLSFIDSNIFELKYNGFTYNEIAILLDISYRYLMYRLRIIRDRLKLNKNLFI